MELLQHQPGTKTGAIAQATGSPVVTVQDRLRRLRQRGAVITKFVIRRCGNLGSSETYWLQEPPSSLDRRGCRRAHP